MQNFFGSELFDHKPPARSALDLRVDPADVEGQILLFQVDAEGFDQHLQWEP